MIYNTIRNVKKILFSRIELRGLVFKSSLKIILKNTIQINYR